MRLRYEIIEGGSTKGDRILVVLHGLFGSGRNWKSIGKGIAESSKYNVVLMDLRNHGNSPRTLLSSSLSEYAQDVVETIKDVTKSPITLLGHSLGGLVAMTASLNHQDSIRKMIVEDASISWNLSKNRTDEYIDAMKKLNYLKMANRNDIREIFLKIEPKQSIVDFLLTNLKKKGGEEGEDKGFYEFDLPLDQLQLDSQAARRFDWSKFKSSDVPAYFIKGGKSDYISEEGWRRCRELFPKAELKTIEGVGHWIHFEKPKEFINVIKELIG